MFLNQMNLSNKNLLGALSRVITPNFLQDSQNQDKFISILRKAIQTQEKMS
jgi:hypothetical protein